MKILATNPNKNKIIRNIKANTKISKDTKNKAIDDIIKMIYDNEYRNKVMIGRRFNICEEYELSRFMACPKLHDLFNWDQSELNFEFWRNISQEIDDNHNNYLNENY